MKIVIDGNIGCGKTTVIQRLNDEFRIPIFLEPLHKWHEYLTEFYKDPKKWAFPFNLEVLMTFNQWIGNGFPAIYERSPLSCRYVFTEQNFESGHVHPLELNIFSKLYKKLSWSPDVLIYINTDPNVCYERMQTRARDCESHVSLDYLTNIHNKYTNLVACCDPAARIPFRSVSAPIGIRFNVPKLHIIDGNKDKEEVYQEIAAIVRGYVP